MTSYRTQNGKKTYQPLNIGYDQYIFHLLTVHNKLKPLLKWNFVLTYLHGDR